MVDLVVVYGLGRGSFVSCGNVGWGTFEGLSTGIEHWEALRRIVTAATGHLITMTVVVKVIRDNGIQAQLFQIQKISTIIICCRQWGSKKSMAAHQQAKMPNCLTEFAKGLSFSHGVHQSVQSCRTIPR